MKKLLTGPLDTSVEIGWQNTWCVGIGVSLRRTAKNPCTTCLIISSFIISNGGKAGVAAEELERVSQLRAISPPCLNRRHRDPSSSATETKTPTRWEQKKPRPTSICTKHSVTSTRWELKAKILTQWWWIIDKNWLKGRTKKKHHSGMWKNDSLRGKAEKKPDSLLPVSYQWNARKKRKTGTNSAALVSNDQWPWREKDRT